MDSPREKLKLGPHLTLPVTVDFNEGEAWT